MIWLPAISKQIDIDVYASIIAYTNLLTQRQKPAKAFIPSSALDHSVPRTLRIPEQENSILDLQPDDSVIILGISDPAAINKLVPNRQILELIDTNTDHQDYWYKLIDNKSVIEPLNAIATSIFEWWGKCWDYTKMPRQIAQLLLEAILYKTQQLNPATTTERDQAAAHRLVTLVQ